MSVDSRPRPASLHTADASPKRRRLGQCSRPERLRSPRQTPVEALTYGVVMGRLKDQERGSGNAFRAVVLTSGAVLALLSLVKFLHLLVEAEFDLRQAPVAFLLPIGGLFLGVVLATRGRRIGMWLIAVVAVVLLVVFVSAIARLGLTQQNWADALLVFAGLPFAVAAVVALPGALRST